MKPGIHPAYGPVVFRDESVDFLFLTRSTRTSDETIAWGNGTTYPLVRVDVSAASHPFSTGTQRVMDTAGREQRFEQRYGRRSR